MAASGVQGLFSIHAVSDDKLPHIFQYLTVPRDWYRAALVCTKWRDIILNHQAVKDQIALHSLKKLARSVIQISPPFPISFGVRGGIFGEGLKISKIRSKFVGVDTATSDITCVHQLSADLPVQCVLQEKLLAQTETILFFASRDRDIKNACKLVLRNSETLEEITSLSFAEEPPLKEGLFTQILGCFPLTETKFITILDRGAIVKWELVDDTVRRIEGLLLFKNHSSSFVHAAFHMEDFIFFNISGEIDKRIAPLEVMRYRKEEILVALNISQFKIVEPERQVGRLIRATSDYLYTSELQQMQGFAVSQKKFKNEKIQELASFTLTPQWTKHYDRLSKVNERWHVRWSGQKDFYQIDIFNAKNGRKFFSIKIDYHSIKFGEINEFCLLEDILAFQCGKFIFLWHIPTKERFLSFRVNNLDGYRKNLNFIFEDIQLYEKGLLLLFYCLRKHPSAFDADSDEEIDDPELPEPIDSSSDHGFYRIVNIPYSPPPAKPPIKNPLPTVDVQPANGPLPTQQPLAAPQPAAQPPANQGGFFWLWPSFWWDILMSGFRYLLRLFH
jgi:hypothetical protein